MFAKQYLGLKKNINEIRFWLTRPNWWLDKKAKISFYSQFFQPGDLCFDVGANNGNFAEMLCELGGCVVAIEPQPACIPKIREKLERFDSATVINIAVGNQQGYVEMILPHEESQIASISKEWVKRVKESNRFSEHSWDNKISVPMRKLDDLVEKYGVPVFCKIDVEGYEEEVLKGLSHAPRFLSFEYTPENEGAVTSCINRMSEIGTFKFNFAIHQCWQFYWHEPLSADELIAQLEGTIDPVIRQGGDVYAFRQ